MDVLSIWDLLILEDGEKNLTEATIATNFLQICVFDWLPALPIESIASDGAMEVMHVVDAEKFPQTVSVRFSNEVRFRELLESTDND